MTFDDDTESLIDITSNKNYSGDVNFSMQYTRWFFTVLGIWPRIMPNRTKIEKRVSIFLMTFPSFVITLLCIPIASIPFVRDTSQNHYLKLFGPFTFRMTSVMKNFILISCRDAIKFCIHHMETDWRRLQSDDDREIMMKNLHFGRSLTLVCIICRYGATIFFNVMPFVSPRKTNVLNETMRPVIVPGVDIYNDLNAGCNYEIVSLLSFISVFYVSCIITAMCNLAVVLVYHACGQIQIVVSRLESLVSNDDDKNVDTITAQKRITFIVRTHVRVLRFTTKIDELLRNLCLIEIFSGTLVICLAAYVCITEGFNASVIAIISYITLFGSMTFNIFIFCRIGELLKDQCEAAGQAAYMTEWYKLPGKTGLALVMFIAMANYPRKLTAGGVIELSITTFGNIMKTSFGYVNMLRTMIG